jgi:hypothetical protein
MPVKLPPVVNQQVKQAAKQSWEDIKNVPGDLAKTIFDQVGVGSPQIDKGVELPGSSQTTGIRQPIPQTDLYAEQKKQLKQASDADRQKTDEQIRQLRQQLNSEIAYWEKVREQQNQARRQQEEQLQAQKLKQRQEMFGQSMGMPTSRPTRGSPGLGGRQLQSALEKSHAETAGRRTSG